MMDGNDGTFSWGMGDDDNGENLFAENTENNYFVIFFVIPSLNQLNT